MEPFPAAFGPVQMFSVVFDGNHFKGEILPQLDRLKDTGLVRIIDMAIVRKDEAGSVMVGTGSDLDWEEATGFGAYVGSLLGFGVGGIEGAKRGAIAGAAELADGHVLDEDDIWRLTTMAPNGSTLAVILIEHRWALPVLEAIGRAKGFPLANEWLSVNELVHAGLMSALDAGLGDGDIDLD